MATFKVKIQIVPFSFVVVWRKNVMKTVFLKGTKNLFECTIEREALRNVNNKPFN